MSGVRDYFYGLNCLIILTGGKRGRGGRKNVMSFPKALGLPLHVVGRGVNLPFVIKVHEIPDYNLRGDIIKRNKMLKLILQIAS